MNFIKKIKKTPRSRRRDLAICKYMHELTFKLQWKSLTCQRAKFCSSLASLISVKEQDMVSRREKLKLFFDLFGVAIEDNVRQRARAEVRLV